MDSTKLPEELRRSARWVLWRLEDSEKRERCKVPKQAKDPSRNAMSTEPLTWSSLDEAERSLPHLKVHPKYAEDEAPLGVGLVIGVPYVGVDLDKCYDPQTGIIDDWAKQLLSKLPKTYTELSPSQRGFHLWYRCDDHAKLDDGIRTEKAEVYARGRYFTMTGYWVVSTSDQVTSLTLKQAQEIYGRVDALRPAKKDAPSASVIQSSNLKLEDLMTRSNFPDLSVAVHSLLTRLLILHVCDLRRAEEQFLTSRLYLDTHWKDKWPRLRESELEKARVNAAANISKRLVREPDPKDKLQRRAKLINMKDVKPRELEWLWEERVPANTVTIFAGDPGVAKSLMTLKLIAAGSTGAPFLDGKPNLHGKFKSLILSMEDDRETILVPRLMGMEADLSMITALDMVEYTDDVDEVKDSRLINLETDLDLVRKVLKDDPEIKLVMIDPISNYMGNKSMFRDQEFRAIMMPIVVMAQETGVAVITIMHNSKQSGRTALQKVAVALGGIGTARIGWTFIKLDDHKHQMLLMKKNLGNFDGLEYTTKSVEVVINGKTTKQADMEYLGVSTNEADNVMISQEDPEERKDRPAHSLIRRLLPRGVELASSLILDEAGRASIAPKTIQRARVELGIKTRKKGNEWMWSWPDDSTLLGPPDRDEGELF